MTGTTTMETGRRPRTWRVIALVSSLSLALAGLVGLGLAPVASAAPPCPDGYTLNDAGTVCSLVQTQLADPVYFCPDGWGEPYANPEGEGMLCSRDSGKYEYMNAEKQYSCATGDPFNDHGTWKCNTIKQDQPGTEYYCASGWPWWDGAWTCKVEVPCTSDVEVDHLKKCYNDVPMQTRPKCHWGDTYNESSGMCEKPSTVLADDKWVCGDGWLPDWTDVKAACDNGRTPQCKKAIPETTGALMRYTCPEGWTGPLPEATSTVAVDIEPYCEITLTATPTVTTADCNATGSCGLTCEQLGNCPVPAPEVIAPEVVAPAQVITPAPATVAAPAAATVAAPAPAAVSAGVAGTAAVADAATVPASVPAGDGSQAPTVPIWALAMIAVGILGMAAAGKRLVTTK